VIDLTKTKIRSLGRFASASSDYRAFMRLKGLVPPHPRGYMDLNSIGKKP